MKKTKTIARIGWLSIVSALTLSIGLTANSVSSRDSIDSEADKILKSMSSYLAETKTIGVNADIDLEVVARNGQKLQLSSFSTVVLQRPDKFQVQRRGIIADAEFIFDGEMLTLYSKRNNVYAQLDIPGTIDDAIRAFELETSIPVPGADLLFADPYAILSTGVETGTYIGTSYINGIECHHLAFREDDFDWQLWVQSGDRPLPMKYVITNKWITSAPQYEIRFRDWDTNPQIDDEQFTFAAPEGAKRLETIPIEELDESVSIDEGQ